MRGEEYDALLEEFVVAASKLFPGVVIQFEDFATHNAFRLLQKYRDRIPTFNDDIQGTAAVALAGLLSALRVTGAALGAQTLLFQGAGEAATGIANLAVEAMVANGMDAAQARRRCWLFDSKGLVVKNRADLAAHKQPYAHDHEPVGSLRRRRQDGEPHRDHWRRRRGWSLHGRSHPHHGGPKRTADRVRAVEPDIQVGVHGHPGVSLVGWPRPVRLRFPVRSGDPWRPDFVPRQGNNSYIFPGVGLGVIASRAIRVTDAMFMAAAHALAAQVSEDDLQQGSLYPPLNNIREVSAHIAAAVAAVAYGEGLARGTQPADLLGFMRAQMYEPRYATYVAG